MGSTLSFIKEAFQHLMAAGAVLPSSRFLARRMLKTIDFSKVDVIVELGPGNGAISKYILPRLSPKALLICFEINPVFYQELWDMNHPQLIVLNTSAEHMVEALAQLGYDQVPYVISSLPLALLPPSLSHSILKKSHQVLANDGAFIQFQYSLTHRKVLSELFADQEVDFELINFPPAFVYRCKKSAEPILNSL